MAGVRPADLVVDTSSPIAEPGSRLGATLIDAVLPSLPELVLVPLGLGIGAPSLVRVAGTLGWAALALTLVVDLYLLHRYGQTIGKRLLGLRVVRVDGSRGGLGRLFFLRGLLPWLVGVVPFFGWAFAIADTLAIFSADRRTIHDHFAGTIVVDLRAPPIAPAGK